MSDATAGGSVAESPVAWIAIQGENDPTALPETAPKIGVKTQERN